MCSIVGVLGRRGTPPRALLESMVDAGLHMLRRRGPDDSARVTVSPQCVMGGNRLIIRGDAETGAMPFIRGKRVAFFNGEIYNFRDWAPSAISDGEAILPAYEALGPACFRQFDGEFAVAIWDGERDRLLLARDHFGTKPLYFSFDGDKLLWGSSASAICSMVRHPLCAVTEGPSYYSTGVPQEPYTSYAGIWQVPPGHVLIAGPQGVGLFAYNSWDDATLDSNDTTDAFAALEDSLIKRLDYDGTVAIPMSGGIDSGIIAFMADKLGIKYHIFSVIEMLGKPTSESQVILERIRRLKNPAGVTLLACNEPEIDAALNAIHQPDYQDSAAFDSSNLPMHTLMRAIHESGLRVVIDGTGADELFHGYKHPEEFGPLAGWPMPWTKATNYYSLFTSLLAFTAKSDRAGARFSLETRYPFQSAALFRAASKLVMTDQRKWPLRKFLLERVDYGRPTDLDLIGKEGFSLQHLENGVAWHNLERAFCAAHGLTELPTEPATPFPFVLGVPLPGTAGTRLVPANGDARP